ncbi:MAG: hypothetical protein JXN65_02005 [Clostridia bacterium]|nr:hypothetical protein [Clostridia bacterium]
MSRQNQFLAILFLFIFIIILLIAYYAGRGTIPKSSPEPIDYPRSETSVRAFKAYSFSTRNADYIIEVRGIGYASALKYVMTLENDILLIKNLCTDINGRPEIIVVNYNLFDGKEIIESLAFGSSVMTDSDKIASGEYRSALLGMLCGINEPWLRYGISGIIFGSSYDTDMLKDYYSIDENIDTLDLFGCRFFENVAGEEKQYAAATAYALAEYISERYGDKELIKMARGYQSLDMENAKNEWLKSIGVENEYSSIYEGLFNDYIFEPTVGYDICITSSFAEYKIQIADEGYLLNTPSGIEKFLYKNKMGVLEMLGILNNSSQSSILNLDTFLKYQMLNNRYRIDNYTDLQNQIIHINSYSAEAAHIHEAAYIFAPFNIPEEEYYKPNKLYSFFMEGFACYMASAVNHEYSQVESRIGEYTDVDTEFVRLRLIIDSSCDGSYVLPGYENASLIEQAYLDYYINSGGNIEDKNKFDRKLSMDAMSYAILSVLGNEAAMYDDNLYCFYESFGEYIAETYGLDSMIKAIYSIEDIEGIFGKTGDELIDEWIDYLSADYIN